MKRKKPTRVNWKKRFNSLLSEVETAAALERAQNEGGRCPCGTHVRGTDREQVTRALLEHILENHYPNSKRIAEFLP